jgi:hypothetical protein
MVVKVNVGTNGAQFGFVDYSGLRAACKIAPDYFLKPLDEFPRMIPDTKRQREFLLRFGSDTNIFRMADLQTDWKMPIDFFGRVVDESNRPVANATAHFSWSDLSDPGKSEADVKSDNHGFFFLVNRAGKRMSVTFNKDEFYIPQEEVRRNFDYSGEKRFRPDTNNPVVFHLRKKRVGADLITSQFGIKDYLGITAPLDGTPVTIDMLNRKVGREGQIVMSQKKPTYANWKQAKEWSFRLEIPDGGFVEQKEEFPFEAPEAGYVRVLDFNFQAGQTNWATQIRRDYYIKFGSPSRYGRLHLETDIMLNGARLTYAINPDGSRYLEAKEKKIVGPFE